MGNRTERDLSPDPREMGRRRFMIAGEHVILRAFEREDAERCYRWMNDPNIGLFVREGCLQRDFYREGSYHDIVLYSMFREQK